MSEPTLTAKLAAIARKHGVAVADDEVEHEKHPVTPAPSGPRCTNCQGSAQLLKALCEPCYRNIHVVPIIEERDHVMRQVSNLSLLIASHEAEIKNSKTAYNKALSQNWRCKQCTKVFEYYGHLFEHEQHCKPLRGTKSPSERRAARVSQRIVV